MTSRVLQAIGLSFVWATGIAAAPPAIENARWITESGNLEVTFAPCGEQLCGTVAKVLANRSMSNPAADMTTVAPATVGMKILTDIKAVADGEWSGRLYNRENGKTYDCALTLVSRDELKIRAYVLISLFGKTQVWKRVAASGQ